MKKSEYSFHLRIFFFLITCVDNRVRYSFSLQDLVALTVKSILCMITALSAHGELRFSFYPFFPPDAEPGGSFREIHSCGSQLQKRALTSSTWVTFQSLLSFSISWCCIPACAAHGIISHDKCTKV